MRAGGREKGGSGGHGRFERRNTRYVSYGAAVGRERLIREILFLEKLKDKAAETTIRQTALDRVATQGGRGIRGNDRHERFWTVLTTCSLQNVSIMEAVPKLQFLEQLP
jgi:hypothetical protein